MENMIHVSCPKCNRSRLFDLEKGSEGYVSIKCPRCRAVVNIDLKNIKANKNTK